MLDWVSVTSVLQAVAGADNNISLISIVEARVVSLLKGGTHSRESCTHGHAHLQALHLQE